MTQEYGLPPVNEARLSYVGPSLNTKPGGMFTRAPTSTDIDYPMGFEWQYQDSSSSTQIWTRVPDTSVWQLLEGTSGGVISVSDGGTGASTLTNHGVLIGHGTSPVSATSAGTAGQVLVSGGASADPTWTTSTFPITSGPTGTLLQSNGTNIVNTTTTYPGTAAQGDVFYGSAANVISNLTKDTNASRYLSNTGSSNNPAWAQVNLTDGVTGVLPVANGGTGGSGATGTATTTDATPTTVISFPLGSTPGMYTVQGRVSGFASVGAGTPLGIGYTFEAGFRTTGAAAVIVDTGFDSFEEGAMSGCNLTFSVSTNTILIQATGVAAYTISWNGQMAYTFAHA